MKLRIPYNKLKYWASRYNYPISEDNLINKKSTIQKRGYLTKENLEEICKWKSPRSAGNMQSNSEEYINEITSLSFKSQDERTRIEVLTVLDGVGWPTASVILHLFHKQKYPLLDFRALWSINTEVPNTYNFIFWWEYVQYTRLLSKKYDIDMRSIDRALWQFSKENQ